MIGSVHRGSEIRAASARGGRGVACMAMVAAAFALTACASVDRTADDRPANSTSSTSANTPGFVITPGPGSPDDLDQVVPRSSSTTER